jgi:hypothetical protein
MQHTTGVFEAATKQLSHTTQQKTRRTRSSYVTHPSMPALHIAQLHSNRTHTHTHTHQQYTQKMHMHRGPHLMRRNQQYVHQIGMHPLQKTTSAQPVHSGLDDRTGATPRTDARQMHTPRGHPIHCEKAVWKK